MIRRSLFFTFSVAVFVISGVGCGPKGLKLKTVPVSGTVTYKGQPVEGATVLFIPVDNESGKPAGGDTNVSGKFTLQTSAGGTQMSPGALLGEYKVTVTKIDLSKAGSAMPSGPLVGKELPSTTEPPKEEESKLEDAKPKVLLPSKYGDPSTSGLTASVKDSGNDNLVFELKDD